jgi:hypothetical protein
MDNPTPIPAYSHLIYNCLRLRHSTNINIAHVVSKPVPSRMVHSCVSSARKCLLCPRSFATSSSARWPGGHHARFRSAGMPAGLELRRRQKCGFAADGWQESGRAGWPGRPHARGAVRLAALAVSLGSVARKPGAAGPARMRPGQRGWLAGIRSS